jgi:hypothetical protein
MDRRIFFGAPESKRKTKSIEKFGIVIGILKDLAAPVRNIWNFLIYVD